MITFLQLGRTGRLGNMLFQVAGCIGIARRSGQPFAFPKLICYDMIERFGSKEDHELYKYLVNPLPEVDPDMYFQRYPYFWEYTDIHLPTGNWDMYAHFQSIKFFEHCIDEIRHYFTFKDEPAQNDYVAIHYRAGDYEEHPDAYHPRCSKEYYARSLIGYIPNGSHCLIFSDNTNEAENVIGGLVTGAGMTYEVFNNNYIDDFKLMKSCKSFICANSSFSHMAALLGTHPEKKIIMPKRWFGSQAGGLNFDTLYPDNAIVL